MIAMLRQSHTFVAALSLLCLVSCTSDPQKSFRAFVSDAALEDSYTGLAAKSLNDNSRLHGVNARRYFVPASTMKLFTTAAALILLGPEFRFTTPVYSDGTVTDGVLSGNLFIRGVGDPTLSRRFHDGGAGRIFAEWAEALHRQGITHVAGNVVGDGSLFGGQYLGAGWAWDDETHCYSAQINALSFDDNCVSVSVLPGTEAGGWARVTAEDASGTLLIRNHVLTAATNDAEPIALHRTPGRNVLTVAGSIPLDGKEMHYPVTVHNPALLAAEAFRRVLEEKGITVSGSAMDQKPSASRLRYDSMRVLTSYTSPPLSAIIREINKSSQNLYAELLFRTMGAVFGRDGSAQEAAAVVRSALERMGIPPDSVIIYDGSGLSRLNLTTPEAIVSLLEYMHKHESFSCFYDSLAAAGVDGTLKHRLRKPAGQGRIAAKTGRMTHVFNLSGYVSGRDGNMLAFALMTNNYVGPVEALRSLQDRLCIELVNLVD